MMESPVEHYPSAWRPLTARGVAVFARASFGRLFLVQFTVALLVASATVWFVKADWYPTISTAIGQLPADGKISSSRLAWGGDSPKLLAESRFLAFAVDLNHQAQARSPAHIQVEFGQTDLRFYTLFGCWTVPYPKGYEMAFNLPELKPWWEARAPVLLAVAFGVTVLGLMIGWIALASCYSLPAWLLGLYADRELSWWGSWRLAGASLMPGALIMTGAIACYGLGKLDVIHFIAAFILHILVGWAYVVLGVLAVPGIARKLHAGTNPFMASPIHSSKGATEKAPKGGSSNPFGPRDD